MKAFTLLRMSGSELTPQQTSLTALGELLPFWRVFLRLAQIVINPLPAGSGGGEQTKPEVYLYGCLAQQMSAKMG